MLKASKISKTFHKPTKISLLKDVSLEVVPGESLAIMGTSGVGKSTLLHILSTLEKPDTGFISIQGKKVAALPKTRNEEIGFVFQSFFLLEHLTVLQNVLMPAKIARKSIGGRSPAYKRAVDFLKKVGLYDRKDHLAKTLSGGEKQRTCIARALANNPSIIFADEPTGNLDSTSSDLVQKLLLENIKEERKSLILVTHDQNFADKCDRILYLTDGDLISKESSLLSNKS